MDLYDHLYMFYSLRKIHPLVKIINGALIDLPAPKNISIWWNYGSLLGLCLGVQIATGLFLTLHYSPHVDLAFSSAAHISRDVNFGWFLRATHANCARIFFLCLYLHIGRGVYYRSFLNQETWNIGVIIFFLTIAAAFIGYVLVWGQIRFWAATVITNIFSAIPYIGTTLVEWLWGGFAVDNATLNRFFGFHFLIPFIIAAAAGAHILFLHQTGSNNPTGVVRNTDKALFHSYYSYKDAVGILVLLVALITIAFFFPNIFTDPENFIPARPLVTPIHIKPEWYFLWVYAILRSIPNKLGGVIALFAAILLLLTLPITFLNKTKRLRWYPLRQINFWTFTGTVLILTWIGGCPVEAPYEAIGQVFTVIYFFFFFFSPFTIIFWDKIIIN